MKNCAENQSEESLEAFKKRIHKLSYDELYDELDAAEKAESEERIAIVEKRIDELEPIEKKEKGAPRRRGKTQKSHWIVAAIHCFWRRLYGKTNCFFLAK